MVSSRLSNAEKEQAAPHPISRDEVLSSVAVLAPPVSWALNLSVSYGLVYPAADAQSKVVLYAVQTLAMLLSLAAVVLGFRGLGRVRGDNAMSEGERGRVRFLSICGCVAGGFFILAIAAQTIVVLLLPLTGHP